MIQHCRSYTSPLKSEYYVSPEAIPFVQDPEFELLEQHWTAILVASSMNRSADYCKRFLQSSSDVVTINEHDALREHGLAAVACLLSAVRVFDKGYQEQKRLLRLVKGVHALHVYATEYWTDYLLANAATASGLEASPDLITLASHLASALDTVAGASLGQLVPSSCTNEDRLHHLDRQPDLRRLVEKALLARSSKRLELEIFEQSCRL
jgi:hypothetical protein